MSEFSDRMMEIVSEKGLTMTQLAEMSGLTEATISRYCSGKSNPQARNIVKLCKALDTTATNLVGRDVDDDPIERKKKNDKKYRETHREELKEYQRKRYADSKNPTEGFGGRIRFILSERGLTQTQLADKSGLSPKTIFNYCKRFDPPIYEAQYAIADALGMTVKQMMEYPIPDDLTKMRTKTSAPTYDYKKMKEFENLMRRGVKK